MNAFTFFRLSVVGSVVLSLVAVVYSFAAEGTFSQDWRDLMEWNGDGGIFPDDLEEATVWTWIAWGALLVLAFVSLVNQVLLFFYWGPSRLIYLISCIVIYPTTLAFGLSILTPVESMLYELAAFLSGATLALAYYSPVAGHFTRDEETSPEHNETV